MSNIRRSKSRQRTADCTNRRVRPWNTISRVTLYNTTFCDIY